MNKPCWMTTSSQGRSSHRDRYWTGTRGGGGGGGGGEVLVALSKGNVPYTIYILPEIFKA